MSDIERFTVWGWKYTPASSGEWVRYDDHRAEVERVIADVVKLRIELNSAQVEASQRLGEVERLKEQVGALTVAVEQADEMKAHAETAAAAEEAETDRVMSERDAARAEVERLTAERDEACGEVERLTRMTVADFALAKYRKRWPR